MDEHRTTTFPAISSRILRIAALVLALLLAWAVVLGTGIVRTAGATSSAPADAAIVLGAAVRGSAPSPVFEERIRPGIALFKAGAVRRIVFTGGAPDAGGEPEALVARRYALARGVPAPAILTEAVSRTTQQNLIEARRMMGVHRLGTALIVSDPLHMKRALRMASDLGIEADGSPTPTTRYRSWTMKVPFLLREIWFYTGYLLTRR